MWLVVIDAKSRFPYVAKLEVGSTTSKHTIEVLQQVFAIEGICDTLVSDNGLSLFPLSSKSFVLAIVLSM